MTESAESIGEAFAADWFARVGVLLVSRRQTYQQAVCALQRATSDPVARAAFDRRLGRIVADTPGIITQPPKRRRKT